MALEKSDSSELIDRYRYLILEYKDISAELAKQLEQYGKVRKELQILVDEFKDRKINIDEIDISLK